MLWIWQAVNGQPVAIPLFIEVVLVILQFQDSEVHHFLLHEMESMILLDEKV